MLIHSDKSAGFTGLVIKEATKLSEASEDSLKYGKYFSAPAGQEKIITLKMMLLLWSFQAGAGI